MDKTFTVIMMEVWNVDPKLVVPRVEKLVDKPAILKAIEDKRVIQAPLPPSPQRSSVGPQVPQANLPSVSVVHEGNTSLAVDVPADALVQGNGGEDVPPSA